MNKERLVEALEDFILDERLGGGYASTRLLIDEYADRIMADINTGIIAPQRPGA